VVWAGLCYGNGEWMLHGWFKDAWGLKQPSLDLYGKGQNVVPMIHVDDLAGVTLALATQQDPPRHVVACDEAKSTLAEIAGAINSELGTGNPLGILKPEETILIKDIELFLTDLRFEPTSCLNTEYQFKYQEGFVARVGDVVTDFRKIRNLTPVKVIVTGPPMSGKTVLAAQIARHYHIHHITATDVIHEYLASCDEDGLAEVAASKEENGGRIGDDLLTRMFRRKLSSKACVNQGYVLDGYPKTAAQNLLLFGDDAVIEDEPTTQVRK
jgi:adenylate kinase